MVDRTLYEQFGGSEFFSALVADFYAGVAADDVLRPMYPEDDLGPAEDRLRMFLEQYWGGPHTYSDERGHPRLRMRHASYHISAIERDAWLRCMTTAIAEIGPDVLDDDHRTALLDYVNMAANSLVNAAF